MIRLKPAVVYTSRQLDIVDITTIAVALELYLRAPGSAPLDAAVRELNPGAPLLTLDEIRSLIFELTHARKVRICRTKSQSA